MEKNIKIYKGLSWKEKMTLYKEFNKTVNPRSKIRTILFIVTAIAMATALTLIMIDLQSSIWLGVSYSTLGNIGGWLLLPSACLTFFFIGQELEKNKRFNKWLEQEKNIIKNKKQKTL